MHRCIDSILNQTYTNFELILVDDGSPDNCGKICDEYAEKDDRIHVIHQENAGVSAARNVAIDWIFANSNSEWITFIDSDDWVHPRYLELLVIVAVESGTKISMCRYVECKEMEQSFPWVGNGWKYMTPDDAYIVGAERWGVAAYPWGRLYHKSLLRNIRYPLGRCWEDLCTTYKLLYACEKIAVLDDTLYYYYLNLNGIVRSAWNKKQLDIIYAYKENLLFFRNHHNRKMELRIARSLYDTLLEHACLSQKSSISIKEKKKIKRMIQRSFRWLLIRYAKALHITLETDFATYYLMLEPLFKIYERIPFVRAPYRFLRHLLKMRHT